MPLSLPPIGVEVGRKRRETFFRVHPYLKTLAIHATLFDYHVLWFYWDRKDNKFCLSLLGDTLSHCFLCIDAWHLGRYKIGHEYITSLFWVDLHKQILCDECGNKLSNVGVVSQGP